MTVDECVDDQLATYTQHVWILPRDEIANKHWATLAVFNFRLEDILKVTNRENSSGK